MSRLLVALVFASLTVPVLAAGPLELTNTVLVEAAVAGRDGATRVTLVAPTKVVPGDRVVVRLGYRNTGVQPLAGLVLADPLPAGIAYRGVDADKPAPELSVDGRRFGALATLSVALPGGGTRAATLDDVRHVRWRLDRPLAPGGQGSFTFRAVLK